MSKIVRVGDESYSKLSSIAKAAGISKQDVIDVVLEKWERDTILRLIRKLWKRLDIYCRFY